MQSYDLKSKHVQWEYYNKFNELNEKYLPDRGEGETIASQVVTVINKLVYKWYNDGDVYDNTHYLAGWANDLSSYANWLYKHIPESRAILNCIDDAKSQYEYELILKDLSDKFLSEEFLEEKKTQEKIGTIYDCDGKFVFNELDDYDNESEDDSDEEM